MNDWELIKAKTNEMDSEDRADFFILATLCWFLKKAVSSLRAAGGDK